MFRISASVIAGSLILSGCAVSQETQNNFGGHRSVFHNPYVAPELAQGDVGPETGDPIKDARQPYLDGLFYPGRGEYAYDREGNRIRLSRASRRELRRRQDALEVIEQGNALRDELRAREAERASPVPSAPPIADGPPSAHREAEERQ
ncbi:MAG: hypothetical protein AAF697_05260 [Pseudomonadota bacterium]